MNDELKVGEIGVLQNITVRTYLNETPAEVVKGLAVLDWVITRTGERGKSLGYYVHTFLNAIFVEPHQIRRLTDPDQQSTIETEREIKV